MALNVIKQEQVKGMIDLRNSANNNISVFYDENSVETTDLVVAEFVVVTQTQTAFPVNTGPIPVDRMTVNTQIPLGVIPFNRRINQYSKGQSLTVSSDGMVVQLEANAAIARGANVEYDPTSQQVLTQSGGTKVGEALDIAVAQNDIIRIKIAIG